MLLVGRSCEAARHPGTSPPNPPWERDPGDTFLSPKWWAPCMLGARQDAWRGGMDPSQAGQSHTTAKASPVGQGPSHHGRWLTLWGPRPPPRVGGPRGMLGTQGPGTGFSPLTAPPTHPEQGAALTFQGGPFCPFCPVPRISSTLSGCFQSLIPERGLALAAGHGQAKILFTKLLILHVRGSRAVRQVNPSRVAGPPPAEQGLGLRKLGLSPVLALGSPSHPVEGSLPCALSMSPAFGGGTD